ncbi:MAG: helix-turn-helix domain-containing protein, partial [Apilactobacillus sp.]|nr:helix-turn-helix domain-containing protein [Apilactobacillus sp.]
MQFGDRLKQQRKTKELTQDDVAKKLNVSRQTISSWENENSYPDIKSLIQLSNLYDISLDTMLKEDNGMKEFIEKNDLHKKMVGLKCSLYSSYTLAIAFYILIINNYQHVSPAIAILGLLIYAMSLCVINSFKKLMINLGFDPVSNPINHIITNKFL